jgi:Uncharacterized protein conserved in bacteria (DUF2312)
VALRKKSATDRQEEEAVLAVYMHALGMIDEEPQSHLVHAEEDEAA